MKKTLLIAALTTALASTSAIAEKKMSIEANPLGIALGIWNGSFLYDATDKLAVGPEVTHFGIDLADDSFSVTKVGVRTEYRPGGAENSGIYVGARASYASFKVEMSDTSTKCEASASGFGAQSTVGYKFISTGGFISKVGAGYSLGSVGNFEGKCDDGSAATDPSDLPYGGLVLEWTLGYKF